MVVGFTKQLMVLEPDATQVEIAEDMIERNADYPAKHGADYRKVITKNGDILLQ
jgi:hypothetical protein